MGRNITIGILEQFLQGEYMKQDMGKNSREK